MMKRFALIGLVLALLLPFDVSAQKDGLHSSSRSSSKSSSKSTSSKAPRTAHFSIRGTKTPKSSTVSSSNRRKSTVAARNANGRIQRSASARAEFMKRSGYPQGRKGYVVDHIIPLECGGADVPSNMQWQTGEGGKIKDRSERNCRRE